MLAYFIQLILCSALLYGYYHFFLRNEKFHAYNRYYLLAIPLLSLLLPLLKIQVYFNHYDNNIVYQSLQTMNEVVVASSQKSAVVNFSSNTILSAIYILIVSLFIAKIFMAIRKIVSLKNNNHSEKINGIRFIHTNHPDAPFSFFKWLFWNVKINTNSTQGRQIFKHEMYHIQMKHSWDLLFMEILTAIFWLSPVFFMIKNEIKTIQEFLADRHATKENNPYEYAEILLQQAIGSHHHILVNPFFHNQLKRRIAMLTSSKKPAHQYLKKLLVLPVVAVAITLFAFSYKNSHAENTLRKIRPAISYIALSPDNFRNDTTPVQKQKIKQEPEIFSKVEQEAKYPGGHEAWRNFIVSNLNIDVAVKNGAKAGSYNVMIQFIVDKQGNVSDVKALTKHGHGMEEEAVRVIKASGKWKPAVQNGREVKAYRKQPITFVVRDKKSGNKGLVEPKNIGIVSPPASGVTQEPAAASEPEIFTRVEHGS